MPLLKKIKKWSSIQKPITENPIRRLPYQFPELNEAQKGILLNHSYSVKRNKLTLKEISVYFAKNWLAQELMVDGVWDTPPHLEFIQRGIETLPFLPLIRRVGLLVLDTGGYIKPHNDLPVQYQIIIPLIQDDGFHFVWQDWGRAKLDLYDVYVGRIGQTHAAYNEGARRVYINMLVDKFDPGIELSKL